MEDKKCILLWLQDPYNLSPGLVCRIKWDLKKLMIPVIY